MNVNILEKQLFELWYDLSLAVVLYVDMVILRGGGEVETAKDWRFSFTNEFSKIWEKKNHEISTEWQLQYNNAIAWVLVLFVVLFL